MAVSDRKSEQVYLWLLAYIDENKFSENQKVPSENALCRRLNVSRETVRVAMEQLVQEGLIYRVKGSGTYFHKDQALSRELSDKNAKCKIGLILQGQDPNANSKLIDGIRSVLAEQRVDLHIFLTDNKFSNERRCLQTVVHQNFQGFIVDGVKASIMSPNLDCYQELYRRRIPVIFYNNYYKNLRYPRVIVNDMECAEKLVGRLIQAGHKRIAGIFVYDTYQKIMLLQKGRPLFIDMESIGLNGVSNAHILCTELCFQFHKFPEEIQTSQGGFTALESKLNKAAWLHGGKCCLNQRLGSRLGHKSHALYFPDIGDIMVKTIPAPHITQTGCRLDQKRSRSHIFPPRIV